jgi:radical SAM/Cys-rich protein
VRPATIPIRLEDVTVDLAADRASPRAAQSLTRRHAPLAAPAEQLKLLASAPLRHEFSAMAPDLAPAQLEVFQVNLGKLCNMTCRHCHVDAGPDRTDAMMDDATVDEVIAALRATSAHTVDLTGGAPELHPRFRDVVQAAFDAGKHVMDRCNLTVLLLPRNAGLVDWLAKRNVEIVASLPHYRRPNTDAQRGDGVFERSLRVLRILNAAGYG